MSNSKLRPPPIDPEYLPAMAMMPPGGMASLEAIQATRGMMAMGDKAAMSALEQDGEVKVEEISCVGVDGNEVAMLVLRKAGGEAGEKKKCIYNMHGGGMLIGSRYMFLPALVELAKVLDVVLVSVEYRLAPEAKAPAQVEDCYSGLKHISDHASELGIDAEKIVIYGGSAGAGLAAGVALLARDCKGPAIMAQCLLYPMLDDRNDSLSVKQYYDQGIWTGAKNLAAWDHMVPNRGQEDVSHYIAPARATDLSGLPKTFIEVGSAEPFRDENVAYAMKLWEAGADCELHVWPGAIHGYDAFAPTAQVSIAAKATRMVWLKRVLA